MIPSIPLPHLLPLRQAVPRPEMDRFVSALASHYSCGIFITTGGFTKTAPQEAAHNPHVTTVDGDQVAELILAKAVCVLDSGEAVDENYFSQIEARADGSERRRS